MIVKSYETHFDRKTSIITGIGYNYFKTLVQGRNCVIVTDQNLFDLYSDAFSDHKCIIISDGEVNKNIATVESVIQKLIEYKIDRKSIIIGFGGGLVCDIAGFAATVYMRGTVFGFVATTLLAQIDAAIGGKNGVNSGNLKNYIGCISQPEFVLCDTSVLLTLNDSDFLSGMGEVIKYSLISNSNLFDYVKDNLSLIKSKDVDVLNQIVRKCVDIKTDIVEKDPNDNGLRHVLNFGHSLGHCIEIVDKMPHGIAVVLGICAALDLSIKFGYAEPGLKNQIMSMVRSAGFKTDYKLDSRHFELLANDKKKTGDSINFVFLKNIGEPEVAKVKITDMIEALTIM